jgi:hypothetical protein
MPSIPRLGGQAPNQDRWMRKRSVVDPAGKQGGFGMRRIADGA